MKFRDEEDGEKIQNGISEIRIINRAENEEKLGNKNRGEWGNKIEFFLSCLSFGVGLGNIWRFPYLCYRNGGGAFLIPYCLMLVICGLPLFFFELCLGQFGKEGPMTIWKILPLFQGLGFGMFLIALFVSLYYNVIIAWSFFYLFSSFTSELPWTDCNNWWNTDACRRFDSKNCTSHGGLMSNEGTCFLKSQLSAEQWSNLTVATKAIKLPADEFFHNFMLDISDGFHDDEGHHLQWKLSACLILSWLVVFFGLFRGVKSMGKAVYFTAIFPYVVLLILLAKAVTLPGYIDGILFYITPQWELLLTAKVWADAAVQIFFSLGPCWGGIITLASYNSFHNNCFRDALVIGITNCMTSVFAGFVIFGIIGFMAHEMGVPVKDVAAQGAGLAFVAYPEAITHMSISPLWSILFFVMLLTLGIGTQLTVVQTVITGLCDIFQIHRFYKLTCTLVCVSGCMIGLTMCTRNGMYILQLLDNYSGTFSALMIGCVEVLSISWIYGVDRFMEDIKLMLGFYPYPRNYWKYMWKYFTPFTVFLILLFTFVDYQPSSYGGYQFPVWADSIGWCISFTCLAAVPIRGAILVANKTGPIWSRIQHLCRPTADWGPSKKTVESTELFNIDSKTPLANEEETYEMERDDPLPCVYEENSQDDDDDDDDDDQGLQFTRQIKHF